MRALTGIERRYGTTSREKKRTPPHVHPFGAPFPRGKLPRGPHLSDYRTGLLHGGFLRFVSTGNSGEELAARFANPDARTRLEISIATEGKAPRRSHPPSPRQVKKDVLGGGSGPGGTASPWGVENVKPVPASATPQHTRSPGRRRRGGEMRRDGCVPDARRGFPHVKQGVQRGLCRRVRSRVSGILPQSAFAQLFGTIHAREWGWEGRPRATFWLIASSADVGAVPCPA